MRKRKIITIVLGIIMVLPLFLGLGGMKDVMAVAEDPINNQEVILHKLGFTEMPAELPNDGDKMPNYDVSSTPLDGAVFTAYDVTEIYWTTYDSTKGTDAEKSDAAELAVLDSSVDLTSLSSIEFSATVNGEARFDMPKKSTYTSDNKSVKRNAIYRFQETTTPAGIATKAADFILGLPVYQKDTNGVEIDEEKGEVHIYPKNEFEMVGLGFTKYGVDEYGISSPLPGAKFILKNEAGEVYTDGTFSENERDAQVLISDPNGEVVIPELALDEGTYEFYEVDSDVSKAGKTDALYHYVYAQGVPAVTAVVKRDRTVDYTYFDKNREKVVDADAGEAYNYQVPKLTKIANDHNVDVDQEITFTITQRIPMDIADYETFTLEDTFPTGLELLSSSADIEEQLTAVGGDVAIANNKITITFDKLKLVDAAKTEVTTDDVIAFDVKMSVKSGATWSEFIKNTVTLKSDYTDKEASDQVQTFGKNFKKIDADSEKSLAKAEFNVFKNKNGEKLYLGTKVGKQTWEAKVDNGDGELVFPTDFTATKLISDENGLFQVSGLAQTEADQDVSQITYHLEEIKTPKGYVLPDGTFSFTVGNGKNSDGTVELKPVPNKHKGSLPSTGGSGIVAFVLIGVVAVGGAALYFTKGRREIEG